MSTTPNTKPGGLQRKPGAHEENDRDRIRDIIVVIVTYPLTPNKKTGKLAEKKPWLEFISLLLKVLLAIYALYQAYASGGESG